MSKLARDFTRWLQGAALAAAALLLASAAAAQDAQTLTYQDWIVRCVERDGRPPCEIRQTISDNQGRRILQVTFGYEPAEKVYLMRAELPLGFLLPPGVMMKIDDSNDFRGFVVTRCIQNACLVEGRPAEDLITALRRGTQAQFVLAMPENKALAIQFSLKGFAAALEEMVARNSAS